MSRLVPLCVLAFFACKGKGAGTVDPTDQPKPSCTLTAAVDGALDGAVVALDRSSGSFDEARPRTRRLTVEAPFGADLAPSDGLVLFDSAGTEVTTLPGAPIPQELFVLGESDGPGTVEITPAPEGCAESTSLAFEVRRPIDLVGRPVLGGPGFSLADVFNADETVSIALAGQDYPDQVGASFDAYIVAHRSPSEWAADASLTDVADGPVAGTVGTGDRASEAMAIWSSGLAVAPGSTNTAYDVVLDFDGDGQLGPGDRIDGLERAGFHAVRDLTEAGPYAVDSFDTGSGYWTTMRVYAPNTDTGAPAPLIVISHGNGHDYTWYDYLGEHFASWGYVAISHRNDTQPGVVSAAGTTLSNTDAFLANEAGLGLAVDVDRHRIGWIGHSRGGEGVVLAYSALVQGNAPVSEFDATDIQLIQSIAPTLFEGPDAADPHGVSFHILSGGADGDVTGGPESALTQYYRMFQRGTGDHWVTYVHGADHNNFNCCGDADGTWFTVVGNPPLIGRSKAQDIAKSYLLALVERELGDNPVPADFFGRAPEQHAPMAVDGVVVTQSMPSDSLVIDDFQTESDWGVASNGGAVRASSDFTYGEGALDDGNFQLSWSAQDQTNGMTWSHNDSDPERGLIAEWMDGDDGWLSWEIPTGDADWTSWDELSLRTCQGSRHPNTQALADYLSFSVELEDAEGRVAVLDSAAYGRMPTVYPRGGLGQGQGWVNEFQTLRIPLQDFRAGSEPVDLGAIVQVRLRFGATWGSATGRMGLDDLQVVSR